MDGAFKYRAFLSYCHKDRRWADWLHRELERFRVPPRLHSAEGGRGPLPRHLRPIFRDREELASAHSLPEVIDDALGASESLIVICSPAAAKSRWVDAEVKRFRELGRGNRIFCVVVDGEPLAGDPRDCFPPSLRLAAVGTTAEPIAADARGGRSGRQHAMYMLIAGLLGVGLDELLQRDLRRRHRTMFAVASGSVLLAVMMAGLTVFAFMAQAESERRRADAENLVGFMLGDLREDLHSIGRLDIYTSVADEAMSYFRSLDEDGARDEVLVQRALALRQIGSARLNQGNMPGALEAYEEALQISTAVAARNPEQAEWQLALAESHFAIGEVLWQRGDYDAASAKFMQQLEVVDALAAADSSNPEWLSQAGYAWTNFGRIMERRGKLDDARQAYERVMKIFQQLQALQPEDREAVLEVGFAHNNLGKLKMELGLLQESEAHLRTDLEIKRKVYEEEPVNNLWREYLAASRYWLGRALLLRGAYADVLEQGEGALDLLGTLLQTDPEMTRWRERRAAAGHVLAAACRLHGDRQCASAYLESSLADLGVLLAVNADQAVWRREYASSTLEAGWQAATGGELQGAAALVETAVATIAPLSEAAPGDLDTRKVEILALLTLGDLARLRAETETAVSRWQSAQALIDAWFSGTQDPEVLDMLALLMFRQGRPGPATELRELLDGIGFHSPYPTLKPAELAPNQ